MKKSAVRLIGTAERFSFEQRIFHFSILMGITLSTLGTAMDLYYRSNLFVDLAFTGLWALVYYLARFAGYFRPVSVVGFALLVVVFLPYQWFMNGGIASAISFYAVLILAIVCIVLRGRFRALVVISLFAALLALVAIDLYRVGPQRMLDVAVHLLIVMAALTTLLVVYSNTYKKEKERSEAYAREVEQNYRQQLYYMETLEGVIDRLKSERHDYNHHLGVIYALLEDAEGEKARAYAAALVDAAEEYRSIVSLPYSMLRAMLNYKLSAAKEQGIALRLDIGVPGGLTLEEADLTVIVGNLMDNAMEACAAVAGGSRYIDLSLTYKPDYLVIQVKNPVGPNAASPGGMGNTSKPDRENHGFGLRNIEYLVRKHNGLMKLEPQQGVFAVNLALYVKP